MECSALRSITLPDSVQSIGKNAFDGCRSLKEITFSSNIKSVGGLAFNGCKALTALSFPNSLERLEDDFINACTSLKSITFGNGTKSIGSIISANLPALEEINYRGSEEDWNSIALPQNSPLRSKKINYNYSEDSADDSGGTSPAPTAESFHHTEEHDEPSPDQDGV